MADVDQALPISGPQVDALNREWADGGLWRDVRWLASEVWRSDGREQRIRWHHLCLAVGNFKRQPGRRLDPGQLDDGTPPVSPHEVLTIDVGGESPLTLRRDDPGTWLDLDQRHGFGTATTTTVLAALWPDDHLICDWRVLYTCAALLIANDEAQTFGVDPATNHRLDNDLEAVYGTVRDRCAATARATGRPLVEVERALYELSGRVTDDPDRSWQDYASDLTVALPDVGS